MASAVETFLEEQKALDREFGVEPFFMHQSFENVPQSYVQKQLVKDTFEVVQIRFPADTRYSPVFKVDDMWISKNGTVITYAERFGDQYRAFLNGEDQESMGTPLDLLAPYGMTPELISYCRANKIYSIQALNSLDGQNLKNLGMRGNRLKDMARQYMATVSHGEDTLLKMQSLEAELAELRAAARQPLPAEEFDGFTPEIVSEFSAMTDDELREAIRSKGGALGPGRHSRDTLEGKLRELA